MPSEINRETTATTSVVDKKEMPLDETTVGTYNGRKVTSIPKEANLDYIKIAVRDKDSDSNNLIDHNYKPLSMFKIVKNVGTDFYNWCRKKIYRPKEKHVLTHLNKNFQAVATRFNGKDAKQLFEFEGCCYAIASLYVLYHKMEKPEEFYQLLSLFSRSQESGWKFYGNKYTDIGLAIEKAQKEYKNNPNTMNPDTRTLLKLRPFAEAMLFFQDPDKTSMSKTVPWQNTIAVANILEGDESQGTKLEASEMYSLGLTKAGFTSFLKNLGDHVNKGEGSRIFHLCSGTHIVSLKINPGGYEICDPNIQGVTRYFAKGNELKLSLLLNKCINAVLREPSNEFLPIFKIQEFDMSDGENKKQDFCLSGVIDKIAPEDHCSFYERNRAGLSAIHLAAYQRNIKELKKMHESLGPFPSWKEGRFDTPLILAAKEGDVEMVKFYLDHYHDPRDRNDTGQTALISAIASGHTEIALLLLKACQEMSDGPDYFNKTPLIYAIRNNDIIMMKELLKLGSVDVNHRTWIPDFTPLNLASALGHIEAVELLLKEKDIQIDLKSQKKGPLEYAQEKGHEQIVQLLKAENALKK